MIYELAKTEDLKAVYDVVQHTIKAIYPKYYPKEVVDFVYHHMNRYMRGNLGVALERRPQCAVSHEVRRRGQ